MSGAPKSPIVPLRLVLASANPDKCAEIAAILAEVAGPGVELVARPAEVGEVQEDGVSLVDNARLKARALCLATGEAAVADDTGLEVEALGGAPGIYAARYAGESATYVDNVNRLLAELARVEAGPDGRGTGRRAGEQPVQQAGQLGAGSTGPTADPLPAGRALGSERGARFRTVALAAFPDGRELVAEGCIDGVIATEVRGSAGFGYDPVFIPAEGDGRTFAEMTPEEKHALSHRGRAFAALARLLVPTTERTS